MRKFGPSPKAEPCTAATPSASRSSLTKSSSVAIVLPLGAVLPIAPLLEGLLEAGQMVLRAVQGLDRRPLRDGRGAGRLLALQRVHRLDQLDRAGGVADAPAGHRIGLRHAVHGQRALVERGLDLR